jgi:hypothetical protein
MEFTIQPFLIYTKGKMRGIMNTKKQLIVPCIYEDLNITVIRDGLIYCESVLKKNNFETTNLVFRANGRLVKRLPKTDIRLLRHPMQGHLGNSTYQSQQQMLQDFKQKVASYQYDTIQIVDEWRIVQKDNLYGCWNPNDICLLPCQFDELKIFKNCIAVKKNCLWSFWDKMGVHTTTCQFDEIKDLKNGYIEVQCAGKYGLVNTNGIYITICKYTKIADFKEGMASVRVRKHIRYYGYINEQGEEVIPPIYEYGYDFSDGAARVLYGQYGVIDKAGNILVPFEYAEDCLDDFHYGIASAGFRDDDNRLKMGAIDKQNQIIIPFVYDMVYPFQKGGYTWAEIGKDDFVIDRTGYVYYEPA